uniref:Secreted protein n=1 Tax=Oryza brachyantha TaxID=4533 RepID=J3MU20_ORYBR
MFLLFLCSRLFKIYLWLVYSHYYTCSQTQPLCDLFPLRLRPRTSVMIDTHHFAFLTFCSRACDDATERSGLDALRCSFPGPVPSATHEKKSTSAHTSVEPPGTCCRSLPWPPRAAATTSLVRGSRYDTVRTPSYGRTSTTKVTCYGGV